MNKGSEYKYLNVRLPKEIKDELKVVAAMNSLSVQEIIIELVMSYLDLEKERLM